MMLVARVTDRHSCPVERSGAPHVGGPILTGSPDVSLGGLPVARLGDFAQCEGPTSVIIEGSATVQVNSMLVAARGYATADGGVIVEGMPTVLTGSPTIKLEWYSANAEELFSPDNMWRILTTNQRGADTEPLRSAMQILANDPTGAELEAALSEVANARGLTLEQTTADYQKFQVIRRQNEMIGAANGADQIPALDPKHASFMASAEQLAYGQVVGEAYGIDPVFASLLNPTGGLVGPGNKASHIPRWIFLGAHAVFHDAGGFLFNFAHAGPGYTYTPGAEGDPSNSLHGHGSGLKFWAKQFAKHNIEFIGSQAEAAWGATKDGAEAAWDATKDGAEAAWDATKDAAGTVRDWAVGIQGDIVGGLNQLEREIYRIYKVPVLP